MATTIDDATMTVTITESVILNGTEQGVTNTLTYSAATNTAIDEVYRRIVNVPTSEVTLLEFSTTKTSGTFIESDVIYIRITNKDDANHISLTFKNEDNDEMGILLDYGQSFIYNGDRDGGVVNTFDANSGAVTPGTHADLVNITALAHTGQVQVEVFVASK